MATLKTFIILSLLLCASFAKAQMHFVIPVQELDSIAALDSSAFRHHPIILDIEVNQVNFDTYGISATTTYFEKITSPFYKFKQTRTQSELELPSALFDLKSAINEDNTFNIPKLNAILVLFGFKYRGN